MYKNAGVMMEMAEFAARNSSIDPALLDMLRSDAAQIRLSILKALGQYALNLAVDRAHESVRISTFRAASMYTGMAARMTQLLQEHASMALPEFVAAM
jgi:protein subunit release factor B